MPKPAIMLSTTLALSVGLALTGGDRAAAADLPEGPGRAQVERVCTGCHGTQRIARSAGYSQAGWTELIGTMIDLPVEQRETIVGYLAANFPPNTRRAAKLVPGERRITFTEWRVPTLGQRARDPIEAADGSIWWAGQWADLVGRIDPATGTMTEYPLPAGAKPHSVTLEGAGQVWYTGNGNATLGRLDPETGAMELATLPRPGSRPYGIKIDAEGTPWFACNGRNCLVKIDPATMALTEIALPDPATTVRRLDIADDGMIWYVNSSQGRLGRFDPRTGEIKEWPSPSGPRSYPYAIAVVNGAVWYNEPGVRPDTLVRFDPATQTFQSWAIPSGGVYAGIVRHMRPTRNGGLLIHQSATNRIILVTVSPRTTTD